MRHANLFEEEPLLDELMQLADSSLITALVERWRPETPTFHLPCGECIITLEDVSLQLGVNVNGRPVTGTTYFDWDEMCEELLGKIPIVEEDMRGQLSPNSTQIQLQQYCRAHILYIMGGKLLPDKSNSRVHLMYLHLLRDLSEFTDIVGVQLVWQTCIWSCVGQQNQMRRPWVGSNTINLSRSSTWRIDGLNDSHMRLISTISHVKSNKIKECEVHTLQDIPQQPNNLDVIHRVDKRGNQDANWATKHAQWIEYWSDRRDQVLRGPQIQYPIHTHKNI
ncbi:hypothetical protein Lal_00017553 [Lupinus albus]|nr:hypothetical protein Lal_00017553 [Lupinus albus]